MGYGWLWLKVSHVKTTCSETNNQMSFILSMGFLVVASANSLTQPPNVIKNAFFIVLFRRETVCLSGDWHHTLSLSHPLKIVCVLYPLFIFHSYTKAGGISSSNTVAVAVAT